MQIRLRKIKTKNQSKDRFGSVLGSIWEGFGALWNLFYTLLGAVGPFFWRSKPNFYIALVQNGLQKTFWMDFGSIWGGFGHGQGGFGRVSRRFGKIEAFALHGRLLSILCVPCSLTFCYRNPLAASLRLAERNNTRGFPYPYSC